MPEDNFLRVLDEDPGLPYDIEEKLKEQIEKLHDCYNIREKETGARLVNDFVKFAKEQFKSGELGNNFGKNQVAELLSDVAVDFLTKHP